MNIMLPLSVAESTKLTPSQKMVYAVIYSYTCSEGNCIESKSKIAGMVGISESSVDSAFKNLIRWNFISNDKAAAKEHGAKYAYVGQVQ